jgi:hypothetical protein
LFYNEVLLFLTKEKIMKFLTLIALFLVISPSYAESFESMQNQYYQQQQVMEQRNQQMQQMQEQQQQRMQQQQQMQQQNQIKWQPVGSGSQGSIFGGN